MLKLPSNNSQPARGPPCQTWIPTKQSSWMHILSDELLMLERTAEVFGKIEGDARLSYSLPRKNSLPGATLRHCYQVVDRLLEKHWPCIYKIGYCHDPYTRFYNRKYGYYFDKYDKWEHMKVLYMASEALTPGFVEAALIQRHKGASPAIICLIICYMLLVCLNVVYIYNGWPPKDHINYLI